ncbi:hypothetical protein B0T17DRAFT_590423 [Bombardia bombarda]|uniref:Mitochondrial division protein 1 n=1 Tax=Bombardia bombarda TaxID=252184 RepID=A0AA39XC38_9PEZI|nr:hypothetical protein B0T17DRAFT_590423 [Bombardia bombarda]
MAPSLFGKVKSKCRKRLQAAPRESSTPSSQTLSPTRPTSQPTPSPPTSTDSDTSSLPSLQERLWNEAYDGLKASEPKLVGTYEKILSAKLHGNDPSSVASEPTDNEIASARGTRCRQMQQLVQEGLDRTQKQASIKRGIDKGLQAVQEVRGIVDKAVHAAPEAAVAWVGVCLGLEILSNPVTEARDNRKGIAYVLSRMEWYWNLASLLLDENKAEQSSKGLRVQLEKHVVQLYEKLLAYQIKSVCLYHRNWAAVIGRDLLKIDDWAGQLSEIKEAEAAVQRDMEQYNTEESKTQFRKLTDTATALEETTKGGLLRDSCRWILDNDEFRRWRDDPQSRLLWIKGDPGKGKTMLLCGIIDELKKEPGNRLSYFFCQATEARLSNATAVLRGLIYLLVVQQPSLILHVREKHDHAGKQLFEDGNAWEALSKVLAAMLDDPILDGAILVVDALDECKTSRDQLLDFIIKPSRIKWIVSSRNWQEIEGKLGRTKQKVRLQLELNQDSISKAVDTYIRYKVEKLTDLKNYDRETSGAVKNHLTSNADGTFLWVALVCQELADTKVVRKRHTLSKLKLFPSGLDPLYERMMEQISDSSDAEICKEILAIASVVYRPTTLEELKVLVESLEEDDYNDLPQIIKACGSFLTLREGVIYFVHQSAKDFLLNKASDQILPSGAVHQHHAIFSRSLAALSQTLQHDICKLNAPGFPIDKVLSPDLEPLSPIRYSCVYWVDHLHDSDSTEVNNILQDNGDVHGFIQKKYLYWLECLGLLRSMSEGVKAVHKLEALKNAEAQQLTKLLRDARRFILSNKRPIEIAPLQAYASALVFSPEHSLIRELYKKEGPDWMALKPRMEADWNACVQTLEGHSHSVTSVVFSADGQRLASGSDDKTVKIWDAATGACVQTLEGHGNWVTSVVFSVDGQRLASGSDDETVKIWDAATGACIQTLEGHSRSVISVTFSAAGQRFASGSYDKTVKIWDAATGACVQTLEGHGHWVRSVVFSADGQRLASGSHDKTVKIWDAATGACMQTLEGHSDWVNSVIFSVDGQRLASGSDDKTVKIWDAATGACVQTLEGHGHSVTSVVFSVDGQRLASGSDDKTVKIWDAAMGTCLQTLNVGRRLNHLSFDPTTNTLLSTEIGLLNLDHPALPPAIDDQSTEIPSRGVRHSGWGISTDGVWIVKDGKEMLWLPPDYRGEKSAVVGSTVAIGYRSGRVLVMKFS